MTVPNWDNLVFYEKWLTKEEVEKLYTTRPPGTLILISRPGFKDSWIYKKFINQQKEDNMCKSDSKQQKHSTINALTNDLDVSVDCLEHFVRKVAGNEIDVAKNPDQDKVTKAPKEPLSHFLTEYPKTIEMLNERIRQVIHELEELLF